LLKEYATPFFKGGSEWNEQRNFEVAPPVQKFYDRLWETTDLITTEIREGEYPYKKIPLPPSQRGQYRNFVSLDTRSREVRNKDTLHSF
jgi:hypothetical protein